MGKSQRHKMTISEEELRRIHEEDYIKKGLSTLKLSEKYNVNARYFSKWFKILGLEIRSNKINSRKYNLNHDYFENIDTPEKAYWLGFIYADGYISSSNGKKVGIALSTNDRDHLEKFKKCIDATYPIKDYTTDLAYKSNAKYSRIIVSSDKMYNDLIQHGVYEKKTDILKPPTIKKDLEKFFILGYFDGDGTIFLNKGKCPFYTIGFVGTDDILNFIYSHLLENGIVDKMAKIEKRKDSHIVSYSRSGGNKKVEKIMSYLYDGISKDIVLNRKYKKFINCKNRIFE